MKYGVTCKLGLGVALLVMSGCTGPETVSNEGTGSARVRIEASRTDNYEITQVRVTALGGFESELVRDSSGGFIGSLLLPAGFNELTGLAFAGDELVGVSAAVPVQIQAGLVTGATIRILDITGGGDIPHSPVVLSLSHPLSSLANQPVLLSVSAVDPDNEPLSVSWSTDCADAVLTSPNDFFTDFIAPSTGTCRVDVTVSDGALSATESFLIVVFSQEQASGAVNLDGEFVSAPQLFLDLSRQNTGFCNLFSGSYDGTCQGSVASPERLFLYSFVDWGNAEPGSVYVFDDCGGTFADVYSDPFSFQARWTPPTTDTVCKVTAQAFSNDGVFSQVSAAVRVTPGVPPSPPQLFANLSYANGSCEVNPDQSHVFCDAPVQANELAQFIASVDWGNEQPGGIGVGASCGGFELFGDEFFLQGTFFAPSFDTPCAIFIDAFASNGNIVSSAIIEFNVVSAPAEIQAFMYLESPLGQCFLEFGQSSVFCGGVRAGDRAFFHTEVRWDHDLPGDIFVSDTCGGFFSQLYYDQTILQADWFTPAVLTECLVQVQAFSHSGQSRTFEMIVPLI